MAKTILKWAGNKTKVMSNIVSHFPESFDTYVEPFAGALGAYLNADIDITNTRVILNDLNKELINLYELFRKDCDKVLSILSSFKRDEKSYLEIRSWDKAESWNQRCQWEKAARTIYLNKQGFNGLYRINKKSGAFNVPYNKNPRKGPYVTNEDAEKFINAIENVEFFSEDFETFMSRDFGQNCLYYLDPPYVDIKDPNKSFEGYLCSFGLSEQIILLEKSEEVAKQGNTVIISNSYCKTTESLYRQHEIHEILVNRTISANASSRGKVSEVVVKINNI